MARQNINIGTGELTGDGESIRSAFDKINDNFTELYTNTGGEAVFDGDYNNLTNKPDLSVYLTNLNGDLKGSVFADDSSLVIDGATGNVQNLNGEAADYYLDYNNFTNTPDLSGYVTLTSLTDGSLTVQVKNDGDLIGSVFGEDSTLLVDATNSTIPSANLNGALPAIAGDAITIDSVAIKRKINTISAALAVGLS